MAHNAVYDYCLPQMGQGNIIWANGNAYNWCCLMSSAPTKTTASYATVFSGELTGGASNYVVGGSVIAPVTPTMTSTVTKFGAANTAFGANDQTYTASYTTLHYGSTKTTPGPLICYHDFGGGQTVSSGTFTLAWSGSGVFTLTSSVET
jgi:hypothetical protein